MTKESKLSEKQTQHTGQDQLQPAIVKQDHTHPYAGQTQGGRAEGSPIEPVPPPHQPSR